jgi:trans-aconitate 2-methyltransferase
MKWDPSKYVEFGDHRDRPFHDLVGRVQSSDPRQVVDLGCGPGNLTATLTERWPDAHVVGIDSSAEMLLKAEALAESLGESRTLAQQSSQLEFKQGDIAAWAPDADTDVVVTNAALQWVPGHQEMLAAWLRALKPGAWFALQVPGTTDESAEFEQEYSAMLREAYPATAHGTVFPFRRIFAVARKNA